MRIEFLRSWNTFDRHFQKGDVVNFHPFVAKAFISEGIAKAIDEPPRDKMMRMVKNK